MISPFLYLLIYVTVYLSNCAFNVNVFVVYNKDILYYTILNYIMQLSDNKFTEVKQRRTLLIDLLTYLLTYLLIY